MIHTWDQLQGVSLCPEYLLEKYLGSEGEAAYYLTSFEPGKALLKLIPENPSTSSEQLALWKKIAELSHECLLPLFDCGQSEIAGESYLYAVFEYPDDSLSGAIQNAPLSESEVYQIRDAVLPALRYLHARGLAHGAVDVEHIVAVGDRIKLASDTIHESPDGASDDIRALDALIERLLPAQPSHALPPPVHRYEEETRDLTKSRTPWWPFAAAVALVAGILAVTLHKPATSQPPATVSSAPAPAPAVTTPVSAPAPPPKEPAARAVSNWRVVAYTFSNLSGAEKRAEAINQKHAGFHAEVFTPKGRGRAPFLVALGGRMSRSEALALQKKARAHGLPRDTFIRNYSD